MIAVNEDEPTMSGPQRSRTVLYALIAVAGLLAIALAAYLLPVAVAGQVSDAENGQPLADAAVVLSNGLEVRSDTQGRFMARSSRFQPLSAKIDAQAYQPWEGAPAFSALPLATATLQANLQPTVLQGQVVDALEGQPVAGATVSAGEQAATTDAGGQFELRRLPRQNATLSLAADGYISRTQTMAEWPVDGAQPLSLPIYPNGLHGVISDAGAGQPLPGALVALNGESSTSLDDGFFYLPSNAGPGQLSVTLAGYLPITVSLDSETALQGQEAVDVTLQPTVLSGLAIDGQTGQPLADVAVTAGAQTATSDGQGRFRLERLHGSNLTLTGQRAGYEPAEQAVDEAANLLGGEPLDLTLLPPHLAGQILNDVTGSPVISATVTADSAAAGQATAGQALSAVTDQEGRFILWTSTTPLKITVEAVGYEPTAAEFSADADLSVGLKPKGVVVTVLDSAGQPLSGARVQGPRSEATTDAQGLALLPLLEPGEVFTATVDGFAAAAQPYDGQAQQRIALVPDTLAGRVVDAQTGAAVIGATVYVYDRAACQGPACRGVQPIAMVDASEDGSFLVSGLPAGPEVMVKAPGYSLFFPGRLEAGDCGAPYCLPAALEPFEARGFYVPFHFLYDRKLIESRLDLIEQSPSLNAVVVDMKSDYGKLAWEPQNEVARAIGVHEPDAMSAQEFLAEAKRRGIYTIARFVTFKDDALAEGKPEWALRKKSEPDALWKDGEDLAWVDPYRQEVRQYEIDLAKELAALGFDELQFDYFRFTGQRDHTQFTYSVDSTPENRREAITSFSRELMAALKPYGVFTAIDVFGSIILNGNEPFIGQNLADMAVGLDYLSPMIYPQVWWPGTFPGCDEPVLCPYKVIYDSTAAVRDIVPLPTRIRPWLQGYPKNYRTEGPAAGYDYDVPEYLIQRQAAEDAGAEGWLFWSGGGRFPDEIFGPMPSLAELEAQVRARQGGRAGPY